MNVLYFLISGLVFIWIVRNIFFWVALWQTKEYRVDRLVAHLRETAQGRSLIFSPINILKIFFIVSYVSVILHEEFLWIYIVGITILYIIEFFLILKDIATRRFKRPVFTGKSSLLVGISSFTIFGLYSLGIIQQELLWLLIVDKVTPFIVTFFVFFLSVPTTLFQDYKIDQAMKRMSRFSKIIVIGITGSFGKSSTKEYTAQILSEKFSVVKTYGTNNTPIGIANTVLSKVNKSTEILVAEMGAYKRGEIAQLCQIVRPKIGIITAVAMQHLSLFGTAETLAKTKYELIESLPSDGIAIFNGNNQGAIDLYKKTKKKKILYTVVSDQNDKKQIGDMTATNIKVEKNHIAFSVRLQSKTVQFISPLIGAHTIENILPGIYLADYLGMQEKEIQKAVASLIPLPKTMTIYTSIQGMTLVDDTFNVNPDGIIAAMRYAKVYKGKKILVLEPMIELGDAAKKEHYRVGKALAHMCDILFLTKKNYAQDVIKGIADEKGSCVVKIAKHAEIVAYIHANTNKSDIVVFEGKEAAVSMNKIV